MTSDESIANGDQGMMDGAKSSAADLLIETIRAAGVECIFGNFGSDHPAIIEALARDRGRGLRTPKVVLCPHESSALSAAHGFAASTGRTQAVFVHTDVGTANLGGAVHNASRSRIPVLIFAGLTPYSLEDERAGSRNTHIQHLQDVHDQHGIVRPYVKWSYDLRTAANTPQVTLRALQIAASAPAGPVYLTAAREVLAEISDPPDIHIENWPTISPSAAPFSLVDELARDLSRADAPIIITTRAGREEALVGDLVKLAERVGIGVVEFNAEAMNFPRSHELHLGDDPHALISDADVLVVLDSDIPWLVNRVRPPVNSRVYVVGDDPLNLHVPLTYVPTSRLLRVGSGVLVRQLLEYFEAGVRPVPGRDERLKRFRSLSSSMRAHWAGVADREMLADSLTPATVAATLNSMLDSNAIVLNESISVATDVWKHLPRTHPGTYFSAGGGSLGWALGAALGVKLARQDSTVVSVVGDGTYFLSAPSSTFWMADQYELPTLTVVLDNGGWNATKRNLRLQYPGGSADTSGQYWVDLRQSADLPGIAVAAGGAWGATVTSLGQLRATLEAGLKEVQSGRSAVVAVRLKPISDQPVDGVTAAVTT